MRNLFLPIRSVPSLVAVLTIVLATAGGCGPKPPQVRSTFDPKADFASYKTYYVEPTKSPTLDLRRLDGQPLVDVIQQSIEQQLNAKGMRKVANVAEANVIVRWVGSIQFVASVRDEASPSANIDLNDPDSGAFLEIDAAPANPDDVPVEITEGGIMVGLIDPKSKHFVWRGAANGVLKENASDEQRTERLDKTMAKLFADYPPK